MEHAKVEPKNQCFPGMQEENKVPETPLSVSGRESVMSMSSFLDDPVHRVSRIYFDEMILRAGKKNHLSEELIKELIDKNELIEYSIEAAEAILSK